MFPTQVRGRLSDRFDGQVVLLTGATGFLGKVVLERLMWATPNVQEIRVLIRGGSGDDSAESRLSRLLRGECFDRLRQRHGGQRGFEGWASKIVRCCSGDIALGGLGMPADEYEALRQGLNLIIHCAALVSWDERIDRSINVNCLGTRRLLRLSGDNPSLRCFLYVSSAFVHGLRCEQRFCREAPFDPDASIMSELRPQAPAFSLEAEVAAAQEFAARAEADAEEGTELARFMPEARKRAAAGGSSVGADEIAAKLLRRHTDRKIVDWGVARARSHGWFDNYTYSKALAEMVLVRDCPDHVQVAIVRPSGITAALSQPRAGWLDAYLLVEPLIHGVGTGQISAFPGSPTNVIDVVPVDIVTSVILAAAADAGDHGGEVDGSGGGSYHGRGPDQASPRVFQVGSGSSNPITLGEIERIWREYFAECPMMRDYEQELPTPVGVAPIRFYPAMEPFQASHQLWYLNPLAWTRSAIELLPFWDRVSLLRHGWDRANRLSGKIGKVLRLAELYCTYTLNEWIFETRETEKLMASLCEEDRAEFPFDVRSIDWRRFWTEVWARVPNMRRHLLREPGFGGNPPAGPRARL
ncbi:unnamed protein product [Prorocentrum cordatum]|uniref:Fatty acyl-CoA reductase n=1 Tax=Prorocentrum cordatum TaxID=2364126 RepID=A0ABN9Y208_9DINO|nr:unnamed protein product [Polarella glacialis]